MYNARLGLAQKTKDMDAEPILQIQSRHKGGAHKLTTNTNLQNMIFCNLMMKEQMPQT